MNPWDQAYLIKDNQFGYVVNDRYLINTVKGVRVQGTRVDKTFLSKHATEETPKRMVKKRARKVILVDQALSNNPI